MKTILEAKNINKYFLDPVKFHVLKDISFTVSQGEFVSIMGKSGCGKSTLLYILSTLDTSYEGELIIDGEMATGKNNKQLAVIRNEHIGFVFQFHYLLPEFSVIDNVMLPAKKLNRKPLEEIREDAMNKLRLLDIAEQADKLASRISGGQKQRVAIARALINDPAIIMGDEPTGNLDSKNSQNVFNLLRELSVEKNLTLLVVTHDQDFADKTDRIITMEDGRIIK
ncbi:ABC transporter ATP-binding protein [bacterium]|nr:ABC transporter ATP-binding protein [bacterium]